MARISSTLTQLAIQHRLPVDVAFELTLRCNLKCVHCYNLDRDKKREKDSKKDLPAVLVRAAIDDIARLGGFNITFTGGEATLHPQLIDFVSHARKHHLSVTLKSNGTLLHGIRLKRLVDAGVGTVHLSLYGSDAATHDTFTEARGSFKETLAAAAAITNAGLILKLNFSLTQRNAHQATDFLALGERFNCDIGIDPMINSRDDGDDGPEDLRVNASTLKQLYQGPLAALRPTPDHSPNRSVQCGCAVTGCGVSSDGEVYPCIVARIPSGNLHHQNFFDIWKNSAEFKRIRALRLDDFADCKPCPDRAYCRRSSGAIYRNTSNYTGSEPWTCMQASVLRIIEEQSA